MQFLMITTLSSAAMLVFVGCESRNNSRLEAAARAFSKAADECLLDVRDRKKRFETSSHCNSLSALSYQFIEAGGDTPEYTLIGQEALTTAWKARAVSALGGGMVHLW